MPSQGHLVCGVRCTNDKEIRELYKQFGVDLTGVDVSDEQALTESIPVISFLDTQLDILERITSFSREELEKRVGDDISLMVFEPIGDQHEIGHHFPQDYVFGVQLTSRYSPIVFDINPEKTNYYTHRLLGAGEGPCKINYEHLGIALEHVRKRIPQAEIFALDLFH